MDYKYKKKLKENLLNEFPNLNVNFTKFSDVNIICNEEYNIDEIENWIKNNKIGYICKFKKDGNKIIIGFPY